MSTNWWATAEPALVRHALWERYGLPEDAAKAIYDRLNTGAWDATARIRLEQQVKELLAALPPTEETQIPTYKSEWE